MSTDSASYASFSRFEQLRLAQQVIRTEGQALLDLAQRIPTSFCDALELMRSCRGSVIISGIGKAGLVGQKLMASLASTGTNSHFLHPAEAIHGDLGRVQKEDVLLMLSFSGETEEVTRLLPSLRSFGTPIIAITRSATSTLGVAADVTLELGKLDEACHMGLAPSTSTTAMIALGDALALTLSQIRGFQRSDFAKFHPGGSLGRKLAKVEEVMRPLSQCRHGRDDRPLREILIEQNQPGRRSGAILLTDAEGRLTGVFTDSDLARLLSNQQTSQLEAPIRESMTSSPKTIEVGGLLDDAIAILDRYKISELPVVEASPTEQVGRPLGLIDITDVVGLTAEVQETQDDSPAIPISNHKQG